MWMYDVIAKKRDGGALTREEIDFAVQGYTGGSIPDYQMSALLMAIFLRGMNAEETAQLTLAMAHSGERVDLSAIDGVKVDKHSTGGVGDKTSLVAAPLAAACGVKVAKMSGRGLGHTGGTVDKLEAIEGLRTTLSRQAFIDQVNEIGIALIGQSGNLAPADKKLYALRDVTGTVESMPLIASSVMSKKLAAGSDAVQLDVKTGSGAFMKSRQDSISLASQMVDIGERNGLRTAALITDMDRPLGFAVGNSLEVAEAVATLRGQGPADLTQVCLALASGMVYLAGKGTLQECRAMVKKALADGAGFAKLRQMVAAQGGDTSVIDDTSRFAKAPLVRPVRAPRDGFVAAMQTERVGVVSLLLGAGRETKEDSIDPSAGLLLCKKTGDAIAQGEVLAYLHTCSESRADEAEAELLAAYTIGDIKPEAVPLILARVDKDGVERYDEP